MPIGRQVKIVSLAGGASEAVATEINSGHAWIVAIIGNVHIPTYCRLPSGAEIGDVVEVYTDGTTNTIILAPANESYLNQDTIPNINTDRGGAFCRKISSTQWAWIQS